MSRVGAPRERLRTFAAKHLGELNRRLKYGAGLAAGCGGVAAAIFAPTVDKGQPPAGLGTFFTAAAATIAAIAVALCLIQLTGPAARSGFLYLKRSTPLYFLVGILAALCGLITSLPYWTYRWLFALTIGSGLAVLVVFTLLSLANISRGRQAVIIELATKFSKRGPAEPPSDGGA